jgi:hypothetical protein
MFTGFGWAWQGHVFFAVRLPSENPRVDAATGSWSEMGSLGYDNFRAQCAAMVGGEARFGDSESGAICKWYGWEELGGVLERVFSAAGKLDAPLSIHNIMVEANTGYTGQLEGQGSDPVLELTCSRDAGATYGAWRPARLGAQGEYRARTRINRWGMFDTPGMIFKGRVTDPVPVRVSAFGFNEAGGGRSR